MEPMPDAEQHVYPDSFATAWQQVVSDPRAFFAAMPETGGLAEPLRFLAVCAGMNALGTFLVSWSLVCAVGVFLALVVGSLALAAVLTLVSQQLFEGPAGFEPVFRAVAYGSAPAVGFWVPWLAALPVGYAWYLQVRGIERVQTFDATRAAVATVVAWVAVWGLAQGIAGGSLGWIGTR